MDPFPEETHWLIQHIINNDLDKLKTSVKVKDINKLYPCKELKGHISPLSAAVIFDRMDIFDFLLATGADPNWGGGGPCPLHHACQSAPVEFVRRLIKAGSRTNLVDPSTMLTPLHIATIHDRQDVMKVLIDAGSLTTPLPPTHPQHHIICNKISELVDKLASSSEERYSKIKLFHDVMMAVSQKSPREVFEEFESHMLEENPLNHLTGMDILLNTAGQQRKEYIPKCIEWMKDNNKLNFYINNVGKRLKNITYNFKTAIDSLHSIISTMEEITSETSLALIPQLLEHLSTRKTFTPKLSDVLSTLYVITQKTKANNNWNQDFINNICTAIVPFVEIKHSRDVRMYTFATLANLPFVHTSNLFTSKGIDHVPEDVIMSAQIRRDEVMTDSLRKLQKHLSKPTSEMETTNTEPPKQPREWNKNSKRWSQQLEKLANTHEDDKVVKVGSVVMGKGSEFRIACGSDGTEVYLGLRDDGTEVAVKRMTKFNYEVLKNEKDFLRLPELDDPSIVRYVDFVEDENYGYLVLQLCEYTLAEYIEEYIKLGIKFPGGRLCEQAIAQQVLTGLKILHHQDPPIIHRDIKPQNVLIGPLLLVYPADVTRKARLADFGISRRLPRGQTTYATRSAGTKCWMAKETINEDDGDEHVPYKRSADIQVAGMLLYYILSGGHHPFGTSARCEGNILDGKYNLDQVQDVVAKDLIERMINEDPKKRPRVEECLAHPYFWTKTKRIEFLVQVGKQDEVERYDKRNPKHEELVKSLDYTEQLEQEPWKDKMEKKVPEEVKKKMRKYRLMKNYPDNVFGLLRYIRNLLEHHAEAVAGVDLMEMFPGLFVSVYKFTLNQGWNTRISLEDFFPQSLDGALSKLTIKDKD